MLQLCNIFVLPVLRFLGRAMSALIESWSPFPAMPFRQKPQNLTPFLLSALPTVRRKQLKTSSTSLMLSSPTDR
jgi:hypothetical protein